MTYCATCGKEAGNDKNGRSRTKWCSHECQHHYAPKITWYKTALGCMQSDHGVGKAGYPRRMIRGKRREISRWILLRRFERMGLLLTKDIHSRHTCDNIRCINPDHLIHGSAADNVRDRVERDRGNRPLQFWPLNPNARLSESEVAYIKTSDKPTSVLAKELGVGKSTIIRKKNSWP